MTVKTTRREFLAAAAAAPILSPVLLGTQNKSGTKAPILGSGAYTYEAIHDWGELPARIKWGNTHGVVEDTQGNIYVHHTVHATSDSAPAAAIAAMVVRLMLFLPLMPHRRPNGRARDQPANDRMTEVQLVI